MIEPRQSEDVHMFKMEEHTGQEAPVVDGQQAGRACNIHAPPLDEDFEQDLVPEIELTRLAPVGRLNFQKLHSLNNNGTEKKYYSIDTTMMFKKS